MIPERHRTEGPTDYAYRCQDERANAQAAYDRVTPPTDAEVREELERRKRDKIAAALVEAETEIVNLSDAENPVAVRLREARKLLGEAA